MKVKVQVKVQVKVRLNVKVKVRLPLCKFEVLSVYLLYFPYEQ